MSEDKEEVQLCVFHAVHSPVIDHCDTTAGYRVHAHGAATYSSRGLGEDPSGKGAPGLIEGPVLIEVKGVPIGLAFEKLSDKVPAIDGAPIRVLGKGMTPGYTGCLAMG
ncbi:hypothetical protein CYMTET_41394 [Cymbomonas tetramitiformis]|uniref:Uncharacterized protein n=1 Tax=Cymbomonas tetramitiformis TaxID=36881 RepID=A0AAE0C619_9CHLO|nr:hypothetical protein CYMTET_41394 [Cymbomonas tetramitiformis]